MISDTDNLCRPANADLNVLLVISGGGGRGDGGEGEGEAGDEGGESKLEKNSAATSEGDQACVARIRGLAGRAPGVPPPPSLGLSDLKLGAALSKAGEPPFCSDCNDDVISMLPPPIILRLVSFPLGRFIAQ